MIFDAEHITELAIRWQRTRDEDTLTEILEGCTSLIEAIVSSFDSTYREDLIQEAYYRIQYALPFFNPHISSLHNYLTTVIRNICYTYTSKQDKEPDVEYDHQYVHNDFDDRYYDEDGELDVLTALIARNRDRFPSIPVDDIDHVTAYIYYSLQSDGANRKTIAQLAVQFCIERSLAQIFYCSTVIYLRALNIEQAKLSSNKDYEFTLLPDIEEVMGKRVYEHMAVIMSGMTIKLP
jgi:hypothetical protein